MKNKLLKTEGSGILALQQAENVAKLSTAIMWKVQLAIDALGNLVKEFPSKVLKMLSDFFLLPVVKCERRDTLRKEYSTKRSQNLISKFFASPDGKKMLKVRNGCQKCGTEKKLSVQLHNLLLKLKKKKIQRSDYSITQRAISRY